MSFPALFPTPLSKPLVSTPPSRGHLGKPYNSSGAHERGADGASRSRWGLVGVAAFGTARALFACTGRCSHGGKQSPVLATTQGARKKRDSVSPNDHAAPCVLPWRSFGWLEMGFICGLPQDTNGARRRSARVCRWNNHRLFFFFLLARTGPDGLPLQARSSHLGRDHPPCTCRPGIYRSAAAGGRAPQATQWG